MTPEKKVQNSLIKYLTELKTSGKKIFFERRQAGGYSYKKGIPDLYAVVYGLHVEIEVKQKFGSLSTMQEKFRDMCKKNDILWICCDDVSQLKEFIEKIMESCDNR